MDSSTVAIIAIITSLGSLLVIFGKTIKNSTCLGCIKCESRTPQPSIIISQPPSPQNDKKIINITEI
jgi:hypothetical protein